MNRTWMVICVVLLCVACTQTPATRTLTLAAYTVPKDVYQEVLIPGFKTFWYKQTGEKIAVAASFVGSGAQSRAICNGFAADVAALSLAVDITRLQEHHLITHDWTRIHQGFVTNSLVVICHRPGNPKHITGWQDLADKALEIVYANPRTSGGAMWNICAIYGAGLQQHSGDTLSAYSLLKAIQRKVKVMDKSARAALTTYDHGIGDVLLTYEHEAILRAKAKPFPYVIADATILIQNPLAVVDVYADQHGNRDLAEAFVQYLFSQEAQQAFAEFGFRPVHPEVKQAFAAKFPTPAGQFTIADLGGWARVRQTIFSDTGIWSRIMAELADEH